MNTNNNTLIVGLYPKISIVTASYNYGRYLEECITSLLKQNYPELEYIVLDGASTDGSVEIIKKYDQYISFWSSKADRGASDAIQKGYELSTGDLFNWLNADDYLFPGTLLSLGTIAKKYPQYDVYAFLGAGSCELGAITAHYSSWPSMYFDLVSRRSNFAQESTFLKTDFLRRNNIKLNTRLHARFDTVLYEEILHRGGKVLFINVFGGVIRHHREAKTSRNLGRLDQDEYRAWNRARFNLRQQVWRRLNSSRLFKLQKWICNQYIGRKMVDFLLGQETQEFHICNYIGDDICNPASWLVEVYK